jgi:hypothetical protein
MRDVESATMPVLSSALPSTDSPNECSNRINQHRAASLWLHLGNPRKAKAKLRKPFLATQSGRVDKTTGLRTEMSVSSPRSEASHASYISVDMDAQSERPDQSRDSASSLARLKATDEMFDFRNTFLIRHLNGCFRTGQTRLLSHSKVADAATTMLCMLVSHLDKTNSFTSGAQVAWNREADWTGRKTIDSIISYGHTNFTEPSTEDEILFVEAKEPVETEGSDGYLQFNLTQAIAKDADTQVRERASEIHKHGHKRVIIISFIGPFFRPYYYIAGSDPDGLHGTIRPNNKDRKENHGIYDHGFCLGDWVDIRLPASREKLVKVVRNAMTLRYGFDLSESDMRLYGPIGKGPSQTTIWSPHSPTATIVTTLSQESPLSKRKDRDHHPDI